MGHVPQTKSEHNTSVGKLEKTSLLESVGVNGKAKLSTLQNYWLWSCYQDQRNSGKFSWLNSVV
jgi:hypothetical protein